VRNAGESSGASRGEPLRPGQRKVLEALSWSTSLTRAALAEQLGSPKATLAGVIDSLVASGLVVEREAPAEERRPGRPAKVLTLAGPRPLVGALVLSGGTLTAAVVTYSGEVLARASAPVGGLAHDEELTGPGPGLLDEALREADVARGQLRLVVVGVPAPVMDGAGLPVSLRATGSTGPGPDGRSYLQWPSVDLAGEMARRVGVTTVVENDANLGALAEATFGAGRGTGSFLYLRLARGVGAGLMVGGKLHRGATGFAGELGHVQVRDDGPLCACGGRGCLHGILGDALVRAVQPAYDRPLTFSDVLDLAAGGETGPRRVLEDLGRTLGRPLADFATLFNPGAIIVDGSFAPAAEYLVAGIRETLDRYAAPVAARAVSVLPGALGDDAELLGAAALARSPAE
jgi:predicted NBD/HSP70 family sugar kinase